MVKPFVPPKLSPALAALRGVLSSRQALRPGGELEFAPKSSPWPAAARLHLAAGGRLWQVETASVDFLGELMDGLDPAELPAELLTAALALTFRPHLDRLAAALGWEIREAFEAEGSEPFHFALNFVGRPYGLPLRLRAQDEAACLALAEKVAGLPAWRNPGSAAWPVKVTLAAGRMSLSREELEGLEVSDILLPPDYPAAEGRLMLLFGGREIDLSIRPGRAEVIKISEVTNVSDLNQPPEPIEPASPEARSAPEVVITFELGKKLLPWGELEALAPGRAFPLEADPLGPVTLTLNGRALAAGRLVDLGGTLGVEITRLWER